MCQQEKQLYTLTPAPINGYLCEDFHWHYSFYSPFAITTTFITHTHTESLSNARSVSESEFLLVLVFSFLIKSTF